MLAGGGSSHLSSSSPHSDPLGGRGGRSFLFGNTWFMLSAYPARLLHTADRRAPAAAFVAAIHRTPRVVRAHGGTGQSLLQRGIIMAACGYAFGRAELGAAKRQLEKDSSIGNHTSRIVAMGSVGSAARPDVSFKYRGVEYCRRVGATLKCREQWGSSRTFWTNAVGPGRRLSFPVEPWSRDFSTSCVAPYSAGPTERQLTLDEALQDKQTTVVSDEKSPPPQKLKLLSGSCYLPHPAKEATGGEDGHFICIDEQAIGVADGVGGWADHGVDAGLYAKELMSKSIGAIKDEPEGAIDPSRVLEKAFTSTKARGSSTACIITLKEQGLHAVNLGDSGFIVVRDGHTVLRSPSQQHDFNFTYQLESGGGSDLPSSADVFHYPVAHGDVIVAGTDGLFDNLFNNEIIAVVVEAQRSGLGAQATAQKIAALARVRALDKHRQSPFAAAAQEAGYRFYGGKLDDITVVISYVTSAAAA